MKIVSLVLLAAMLFGVAAALAAAPGSPERRLPDPLEVRFTEITALLKASKKCPDGTVNVKGASTSGGVAATASLCLLRSTKISSKTTVITSRASIKLAEIHGTLRGLVRIVEVTIKPPESRRTITGVVFPGTGAFRQASGKIEGKGKVTVVKGAPVPDLTFRFDFD